MKPVSSICLHGSLVNFSPSRRFRARRRKRRRPNGAAGDPQKVFEAGEAALHAGKLDEAEREFRQVLAINSGVAGAYSNLGVIICAASSGRKLSPCCAKPRNSRRTWRESG
jgi:Flp pilus assembly protein TadD